MSRRFIASAVGLLLLGTTVNAVAFVAPARADEVLPPTFSADPLPTWQTNGTVWALETIGNVVYAGGTFTKVRPPGAVEGDGSEVDRVNFAAFNATTGDLLPCNPTVTNTAGTAKVYALEASPAGDRLYVGGNFSRVGTTGVASFVALAPSTCALLPSATFRRPNMANTVRAITATSTNVYTGGEFITVDSQSRARFAGFTSNGTLMPGSVNLDGIVRTVLAAPDFGKVFIGGEFNTVNGTTNKGLVGVDPATLAVAQLFPGVIPASSVPKAMARDATTLYVGDEGSGFGVFDGRLAADLATGAVKWKDYCLGATQALAVDGGVLYAGHHAHECSVTAGGWIEDGFRNHLSAQDVTTKTLIPTFIPDTDDGIGGAPLGPRALVVAGDQLWAGGEFAKVNEGNQRGLTRFGRPDTGKVPPPNFTVATPRVGMNIVTWIASFDRDEDALTYDIYRNDVIVHTVTVQSREWARPQLQFVDTGVTAGQVVSYRFRVSEPDGQNIGVKGSITTVTSASSNTGYRAAVLADNPSLYWKLDETTEQEARTRNGIAYYRARMLDSSGKGRQSTADRGYDTVTPDGYALGGPSALDDGSGASIQFTGTTGRVAEGFTNDFVPVKNAPGEYTMELWFKTSGTTGGRLAGFGDRRTHLYERFQTGTAPPEPPLYINSVSTVTDRLLYLNDSGKLSFGVIDGSTKVTVKSANSYNDQQWHYAAASQGPGGMRLFVDGVQVGSRGNSGNNSYPGYWKLGYDSLTGWPDKPASTAVKAYVDEFAVYPDALTPSEIAAHYIGGRPNAVIDLEPPSGVSGLSLSRSGQAVTSTWTAATDNVGISTYAVYRTATADEPLTGSAMVGTSATTSYTETGVPVGTWYYRIVANDAAGNQGEPSAAEQVSVPAPPLSLTVNPVADTYVHSTLPTTNFGTSSTMIADGSPSLIPLMRFNVPAAPAGKVLTGAVLRLRTTADAAASSVDPHSIVTAGNSWAETTVTWNTRPTVGTSAIGAIPANTTSSKTYDVSLDIGVVGALLGTQTSLAISAGGPDSLLLATREASSANRPQLILNFDNP